MLLIFHVRDEPDLAGWQSGLYYIDDRPKASLPLVSRAIKAVETTRTARATAGTWSRGSWTASPRAC
jgi:hypothetical protein